MIHHSKTSFFTTAFILLLLSVSPVIAQTSLHGAWQVVEVSGSDADGDFEMDNLQPSLYIFLDGHYSIMYVGGEEPRPLMPEDASRSSITEEQMRSIFMPFVANSGTYEIDGSTITSVPMVALWPNFMEDGSQTFTFNVKEDNLYLTYVGSDYESTLRLQRLE